MNLRLCTPALLILLGACSSGPDYVRPPPPAGVAAPAFKESGLWKPAEPAVIDADGHWWKLYRDADLDALVEEANRANQSLRVAEAQLRQARAQVQGARAAEDPTLGYGVSEGRQRSDSNGPSVLGDYHNWGLQAGWEPDFWGRVSRTVEAAGATAQASAADLAAARLTVQATLVNDYLQLRVTDRQIDLYARTLDGYRKALALTTSQFKAGVATRSDVALAESTLTAAQAQAVDLDLSRRQLEHAIAVLLAQYRAGTTNYLSVVVAQNLTLTNERSALAIRGRELAAGVTLVKAIGGGWDANQLKPAKNPMSAAPTPPVAPATVSKSDS